MKTRIKICCIASLAEAQQAISYGANVEQAIKAVRPFGVDLCSGVRTDDLLDITKLQVFSDRVLSKS